MSGPNVQLDSNGYRKLASSGGSSGPDQLLAGTSDGCCCASSSSVYDPCVSAPSSLAILDYTDSYFDPAACSGAYNRISTDCVWDGTFQAFDPSSCTFTNAQCFNGDPCWDCCFNGKRMWPLDPPGISSVWYEASTETFYMLISGQTGSSSGSVVWQGSKTDGNFSGVYTRTGGCDTRATVEIG